ncbi:MAG: toll/interleukin-1 receptor domain-containing protein [Rhodospirillales bacterium]
MPDERVIFISYRRSDAGGHARHLHEYLTKRFGEERVFFDRATIESGDVFPDALRRGVEKCVVLLALIGPEWLDITGADGRRLDDPDDFVRLEIALALKLGKKVIPVLFDDAPIPHGGCLPEPLKALGACDALTLRGKTFEYNTQRRELVRLLAKLSPILQPFPEEGETTYGVAPEALSALVDLATRGFQQASEAQRHTIGALEKQLGSNDAQIQAFFRIIGEANVPPVGAPH